MTQDLADKLNAELEAEFGQTRSPLKLAVTQAPQPPMTIDQQVEVYVRAGPDIRQKIIAARADLTARFERDMAAHMEAARSAADKLRAVYEGELARIDQLARRIEG